MPLPGESKPAGGHTVTQFQNYSELSCSICNFRFRILNYSANFLPYLTWFYCIFGELFNSEGAFSHSANYCVVYPGTTPENHPPTEACMVNSKQHGVQNSGHWDPYQTKHKNPSCTSRGCRVQNSGPCDPWPPVVENGRLFAEHTVRPQNLRIEFCV